MALARLIACSEPRQAEKPRPIVWVRHAARLQPDKAAKPIPQPRAVDLRRAVHIAHDGIQIRVVRDLLVRAVARQPPRLQRGDVTDSADDSARSDRKSTRLNSSH